MVLPHLILMVDLTKNLMSEPLTMNVRGSNPSHLSPKPFSLSLSLSLSFSLSPTPRWLPLSHPYPRRLKTPSFMVETHFFHYHLPLFSQINAMATFMPALSSFSSMGTIRDAGPKMQTILVFGIRPSFGSSFNIPSMSIFAISL